MLRREDSIRLQHMLDAAIEAVGYIEDRTRNDLERIDSFSIPLSDVWK